MTDQTDRIAVMDVGGSHASAALVALDGPRPRIVTRATGELHATGDRDELLRDLVAPAVALGAPPVPWMIALPGPFDYLRGVGHFEGVGKFDALAGLDLAAVLAPLLGTAPETIRFVNDAAAFARGEWSASRPRPRRFVGITLGTGVGSGFLADGVPVDSGPQVPPSGWVHLLEIDGAPLERRVSTAAIVADYAARGGGSRTVAAIAEAARSGDDLAREVWTTAMATLGEALAPWFDRFGAEEVAIGGGMSRSWDLIEAPLRAGLDRGAPGLTGTDALADDLPVVAALGGDNHVDIHSDRPVHPPQGEGAVG